MVESKPPSPAISVIVPTLDEETRIGDCARAIGTDPPVELVVSDGGSTDRTIEIVRRLDIDAIVVSGPPGRGGQLNRGAAAATSDRLLFLHADCVLPAGWFDAVLGALDDPETALATFRLSTESFVEDRPVGWRRRWLSLFDLRSRGWGLPYGDQGFGLRREVFDALGGFPDIPLMEDVTLARRCRRAGRIHRLPQAIRTTARRLEQNPLRTQLILITFPSLHRLGVPPETLARWYGVVR